MNRSSGVTAAAITALVGSILWILLIFLSAFGMILGFKTIQSQQGLEMPAMGIMGLGIAIQFAFGVWGVLTAIGVLWLKEWARICMLVFSGLLIGFSVLTLPVVIVMPLPATPAPTPNFNFYFKFSFAAVCSIPIAIGVWWLVLFTRRGVALQFALPAQLGIANGATLGGPAGVQSRQLQPSGPRRPVSITVIAWFMAISGFFLLPSILMRSPAAFLTLVLHGAIASVYSLALAGAYSATGLGLLRNKHWSISLAIGLHIYTLLNSLVFFTLPGAKVRWAELFAAMPFHLPPEMVDLEVRFMPFSMGIGILIALVILYFLLAGRKAFLEAARASEQARLPQI